MTFEEMINNLLDLSKKEVDKTNDEERLKKAKVVILDFSEDRGINEIRFNSDKNELIIDVREF